ncbi:MAG: cytochrome c biogenesis protein CcsA [Mailhella sp.]|nr:cytochrome c biogenesis protein CcsA [Mailhella sp.]
MLHSKIAISALLGGLSLAICQWLVFAWAPEEKVMGLVQKIFYMHLPLAWWGLVSFATACAASLLCLIRHDRKYDLFSASAVETGMLFCTLTLVTGSIWGRHSWGVWWTWDPRLTTALILWFIYAGCMALRSIPMPEHRKASLCSVVTIVGFLDVPLVFLSARLWRSIHPSVFAANGGGLDMQMAVTAIACVAAFFFIWLSLLLIRYRQLLLSARLDSIIFEQLFKAEQEPAPKTKKLYASE